LKNFKALVKSAYLHKALAEIIISCKKLLFSGGPELQKHKI